jgi:hypothetical protein
MVTNFKVRPNRLKAELQTCAIAMKAGPDTLGTALPLQGRFHFA